MTVSVLGWILLNDEYDDIDGKMSANVKTIEQT
jgi:hypothetical protein